MARKRGQGTGVQRTQAQTTNEQRDRLREISNNDESAIAEFVSIRLTEAVDTSDLDGKTFALANIAALIATGGDDASYLLHVGAALDAGASVDEITGVLTAVGPNVGNLQDGDCGRPTCDSARRQPCGGQRQRWRC